MNHPLEVNRFYSIYFLNLLRNTLSLFTLQSEINVIYVTCNFFLAAIITLIWLPPLTIKILRSCKNSGEKMSKRITGIFSLSVTKNRKSAILWILYFEIAWERAQIFSLWDCISRFATSRNHFKCPKFSSEKKNILKLIKIDENPFSLRLINNNCFEKFCYINWPSTVANAF